MAKDALPLSRFLIVFCLFVYKRLLYLSKNRQGLFSPCVPVINPLTSQHHKLGSKDFLSHLITRGAVGWG